MQRIELGDSVKDQITGFTGIAVGITEWLNGCTRIVVQPQKLNKDGGQVDSASFDEPQLDLIAKKKISVGPKKTGGPGPNAERRTDVKR